MDRYRVATNARNVVCQRETGVRPQIFGFLLASAVHLVSGPERFLMKRDPQATERAFEMIFRLLLRPVGGGIESWAVFRRQREWQGDTDEDDPGCILWHATGIIVPIWRTNHGAAISQRRIGVRRGFQRFRRRFDMRLTGRSPAWPHCSRLSTASSRTVSRYPKAIVRTRRVGENIPYCGG